MDGIGARPALICGTIRCVDSAEFFEGGPYPALYEGLTLALVMVGRAAVRLSVRPLIALGVAAFFAAGFGAVKYSPVIPVMGTLQLQQDRPVRCCRVLDDHARLDDGKAVFRTRAERDN